MPDDAPTPKNRALVVDDDRAVCNAIARCAHGIVEVVAATRGDEALHLVRERTDLDMFVFDVFLDGPIDGFDLVDEAIALRPAIPRALMSGTCDLPLASRGMLTDTEVVAKPPSRDVIRALFARLSAKRMLMRDVDALVDACSRRWRLTATERAVFAVRVSGQREEAACATLAIGSATYRTRVRGILRKSALAGHAFSAVGELVEALLSGRLKLG